MPQRGDFPPQGTHLFRLGPYMLSLAFQGCGEQRRQPGSIALLHFFLHPNAVGHKNLAYTLIERNIVGWLVVEAVMGLFVRLKIIGPLVIAKLDVICDDIMENIGSIWKLLIASSFGVCRGVVDETVLETSSCGAISCCSSVWKDETHQEKCQQHARQRAPQRP